MARLNFPPPAVPVHRAWSIARWDPDHWLEVDLGIDHFIHGIIAQGALRHDWYVTKVSVSHSLGDRIFVRHNDANGDEKVGIRI